MPIARMQLDVIDVRNAIAESITMIVRISGENKMSRSRNRKAMVLLVASVIFIGLAGVIVLVTERRMPGTLVEKSAFEPCETDAPTHLPVSPLKLHPATDDLPIVNALPQVNDLPCVQPDENLNGESIVSSQFSAKASPTDRDAELLCQMASLETTDLPLVEAGNPSEKPSPSSPRATGPQADDLGSNSNIADNPDISPAELQRFSEALAAMEHQEAGYADQADKIQQLLVELKTQNAGSADVIDLPPICLSTHIGIDREKLAEDLRAMDSAHGPAALGIPESESPQLSSVLAQAGQPESRPHASSLPVGENDFKLPAATKPTPAMLTSQTIRNYNPHQQATAAAATLKPGLDAAQFVGSDPHAEVFSCDQFPSAVECRKCHEQIYDEWSSSSHAYAAISPMFQKFEQKINDLTQGTIGYFCMRCHAPVATTVKHRRDLPIWDGPRVYREGVTCIACHRVKEQYGKVNGERRIEPGSIYDPVYGGSPGKGVEKVIENKDFFKVKTDPQNDGIGLPIHRRAIQFEQLHESTFCVSCHQVAVQPGIKLEVVWDQYRASPAYREGTTCQDCHMGKVPGVNDGYSFGPAAVVNGLTVDAKRKHSNHAFYGPGYSIAHPGIFPQNPDADRWSVNDWLQFDWRNGWGTDDFEDRLANGEFEYHFPEVWANADDRYDAREVIDANLKKLAYKTDLRRQVMENGSKINGPYFDKPRGVGQPLVFRYEVCNINRGHNMPSGSLGAQPQLWLNVVLIGPDGQRLWESGYQDSLGDLADIHSEDVLNRRLPFDRQLFNLQTKFLVTNVKGTDREFPLPVNFDVDQLPFIRPGQQPISVMNHPPLIRMEAHSISPLGSRDAQYRVPAHLLSQPGMYRLSVRLRSRAEPLYFMRFVDSTPEMMRAMNEGTLDAHAYTVAFEIE
jgi:nitrate/TMAO reductase-like tetraheme cytochrome c subunit